MKGLPPFSDVWKFFTGSIVIAAALGPSAQAAFAEEAASLLVVVGAQGTPEFGEKFRTWADRWKAAAQQGNVPVRILGIDDADNDREQLEQQLKIYHEPSTRPLWLVLIGHGTYDGKSARFALRGPDVSSRELAEWLSPLQRPVAVIDCASSSGPFLADLSAPDRVIVTATRSGNEYNFSRLGDALSAAMTDPAADLDKDDQTSLLEAFVLASSRVREFYASESRLATEHALIDDNGDRQGTPAEWFRGVRAIRSARSGAAVDGELARRFILVPSAAEQALPAESLRRRDALEQELTRLRNQKADLPEADYLNRLETILVSLGEIYRTQKAAAKEPPTVPEAAPGTSAAP